MDKQLLISFIKKYHLEGAIEECIWSAKNGVINTRLITEDKGLLGEVSLVDGGPAKFDCDQIAVKDTSGFLKMLSVLSDDVTMSLYPDNKKPKSLKLSDGTVKESYALADPSVIGQVPVIKNAPDEFEVSVKLDPTTKSRFLKTISALPDNVNFTLNATDSSVEISFGDPTVNMNLISFPVEFNKTSNIGKLIFSVTAFKSVLTANSDYDKDPELLVSGEGLAKLQFDGPKIKSVYYLVAKSDME